MVDFLCTFINAIYNIFTHVHRSAYMSAISSQYFYISAEMETSDKFSTENSKHYKPVEITFNAASLMYV